MFRPAAVALPRGKSECNERPTLSLGVRVASSRRGSATRHVSLQESALCLYVFVFVQQPWLCHAASSKSESTGVTHAETVFSSSLHMQASFAQHALGAL